MSSGRSTEDICQALKIDPSKQDAFIKHVTRFCDEKANFSPTTVGDGLAKIHGTYPYAKGAAISAFNATHSSTNIICPVTGARIEFDPETGYGKFYHLGTTRIWNPDGSINEERWNMLVDYVSQGLPERGNPESLVPLSVMNAY